MIRVSFYLNSPKTIQSPVYVSITMKKVRLRFPTGHSILTCHVSKSKQKGKSFLVKGMPHYFSYDKLLKDIEEELINYSIELDFIGEPYSLVQVKDKFCSKRESVQKIENDFFECFNQFVDINRGRWTNGTLNHFITLEKHLYEFEKIVLKGKIEMQNVTESMFVSLRDEYFVNYRKLGNSTSNNYLKKFKQFCEYAVKKGWILTKIYFDEFKRLDEVETFHIALKRYEVDALIQLDLSSDFKLDRVRDLFLLEIYTGQRFSDIPQVLDLTNDIQESITLYQKKTFGKAFIPIHGKLKKHLEDIKNKNYSEIISISLQKFNQYLKEIGKLMKMDKIHHWKIKIGKDQISKSDYRYNLISSHTGRRTFCTLALASNIDREAIMKVTGHKSYEDFRKYVKIDDEDIDDAFDNFLN